MSPGQARSRPGPQPGRAAPGGLRVPDDVAALIRTLHPDLKHKVRAALRTILSAPDSSKPLRAELAGLRSFRLGQLRVVYRYDAATGIEIVALGPRRWIYEETLRRIRTKS